MTELVVKTTRHHPGVYTLECGGFEWFVERMEHEHYGTTWYINGDNGEWLDPTNTLWQAKDSAMEYAKEALV